MQGSTTLYAGACLSMKRQRYQKKLIVIVVRFLDSKFAVQEALLGFYDAFNLAVNTQKLVSVSTDEATIMNGKDSGCVSFLKKNFPVILYPICFAHSLKLCINSSMSTPGVSNCMPLIAKITSFFKYPKRNTIFVNEQKRLNLEPKQLLDPSPTRQIQRLETVIKPTKNND